MDTMKMQLVLNRVKGLLSQWAPKEITLELSSDWSKALQDFPPQVIKAAFDIAVKTREQWPSIAEIRRLCSGVLENPLEQAAEASAKIESAIRKYGYSDPKGAEKWLGPLAWEVVRICGGWFNVCQITDDQLISSRKQWRDVALNVANRLHGQGTSHTFIMENKDQKSTAITQALQIASQSIK